MSDGKTHVCSQEKEIGELTALMERVVKEIYGNGREGMSTMIPRLEIQIKSLMDLSNNQATLLSALTKAVTESSTIDQFKSKQQDLSLRKTAILITSILGLCSIIITVILKLI